MIHLFEWKLLTVAKNAAITMAGGGGLGAPAVFLGSDSLKLNCRKNSLVSLFQWDQKRCSDLSTSLEGTWWLPKFDKCEEYGLIDYKGKPFENQTLKAMVSYGSAAKRRYCHFLSGGSTWWSFRTSWVQICKKQTSEQCRKSYKGNVIMNAGNLLFISRHEAVPWEDSLSNLWIVHLLSGKA